MDIQIGHVFDLYVRGAIDQQVVDAIHITTLSKALSEWACEGVEILQNLSSACQFQGPPSPRLPRDIFLHRMQKNGAKEGD